MTNEDEARMAMERAAENRAVQRVDGMVMRMEVVASHFLAKNPPADANSVGDAVDMAVRVAHDLVNKLGMARSAMMAELMERLHRRQGVGDGEE